jgi:hypothetical protein
MVVAECSSGDAFAGNQVRFEIPTKNKSPAAGLDRAELAFTNQLIKLGTREAGDV